MRVPSAPTAAYTHTHTTTTHSALQSVLVTKEKVRASHWCGRGLRLSQLQAYVGFLKEVHRATHSWFLKVEAEAEAQSIEHWGLEAHWGDSSPYLKPFLHILWCAPNVCECGCSGTHALRCVGRGKAAVAMAPEHTDI